MKNLIAIIFVSLLFVIQLTLSDLHFWPSTPNLVLIFAVLVLLYSDYNLALVCGLAGGLLLDFFSGYPDGVFLAAVIASLIVTNYLGQAFFRERSNNFLPFLYLCVAIMAFTVSIYIIIWVLSLVDVSALPEAGEIFGKKMPASLIASLIVYYPLMLLYGLHVKLQDRFAPKHESI